MSGLSGNDEVSIIMQNWPSDEEEQVPTEKPVEENKPENADKPNDSEEPNGEESQDDAPETSDTESEKAEEDPEQDSNIIGLLKEEGEEYQDDAEFISHYKSLKENFQKLQSASSKINEMISEHAEFALIVKALGEKKTLLEALVEAGIPDYIPQEGDYDFDQYKEVQEQTKKKRLDESKKQQEVESRVIESQKFLDNYTKSNSLGDEYLNVVFDVVDNLSKGQLDEKIASLIHKGMTYDRKVTELQKQIEDVRKAGVVQGRNEKIVKERQLKSKDAELPDIDSKTGKEKQTGLSGVEKKMLELNNRNTFF